MILHYAMERVKSGRALCLAAVELFLVWAGVSAAAPLQEKRFVFVSPGYNNAPWARKFLESVFAQDYKNYHIILIDDASTDNAVAVIEACITEHKRWDQVTFMKNKKRIGMLANRYRAIYQCQDTDIVVMLDADDWLLPGRADILSFYNKLYDDSVVWMTYGQHVTHPAGALGNAAPPDPAHLSGVDMRTRWFAYTHLRTFYAWLFKLIKTQDLMWPAQRRFIPILTDLAIIYPIVEMCGTAHARFVSEPVCVYNLENPLTGHFRRNRLLAQASFAKIMSVKPYPALSCAPPLPLSSNEFVSCDWDALPEAFAA